MTKLYAQENLFITDRPGLADSPFSVDVNSFQGEVGLDYLSRAKIKHIQLPNTLLRKGISKKTELRLYAKHAFYIDTLSEQLNALYHPIGLGTKINLLKQKKFLPHIGLMTHVYFPTQHTSNENYLHHMSMDFLFLFQHNIGEDCSINYNIGFFTYFHNTSSLLTSSWCFNYMITNKLGSFIEYYNLKEKAFIEHAFDGGLTFLYIPTYQLDLSCGISNKHNYFISMGVSFQIR